jgi:hypothetical protein
MRLDDEFISVNHLISIAAATSASVSAPSTPRATGLHPEWREVAGRARIGSNRRECANRDEVATIAEPP